jgi:cell division protein FtsZ
MGDEVRVTVIAAGFERWEEGHRPVSPTLATEERSKVLGLESEGAVDIFAEGGEEPIDLGDDDFDVPSFLR